MEIYVKISVAVMREKKSEKGCKLRSLLLRMKRVNIKKHLGPSLSSCHKQPVDVWLQAMHYTWQGLAFQTLSKLARKNGGCYAGGTNKPFALTARPSSTVIAGHTTISWCLSPIIMRRPRNVVRWLPNSVKKNNGSTTHVLCFLSKLCTVHTCVLPKK